ncbi:helix-turn-helix domain-containing protein [Pseudomonas sp. 2FG]|uniref:helix-turn-helix domain-containing protein n=1 Tax=Pseudomonas sp. 2FG TaxID=2502191 RepID=UPI0010F4A302|nr:cupin domain-containing protein [Pseudomonas sp. 2FG]
MTDSGLGLRIRDLRKRRGVRLQQVADRIGRSVGFVSQIERGLSNPSIEDVSAIAELLGVDYRFFFTPTAEPAHSLVVHPSERRSLSYRGGISDQLLSPLMSGKFHMLLTELEPGARSSDEASSHEGEQGGYVLEGQLRLWVDDECLELRSGDSFQFLSSRPHHYLNPGDTPTRILWVFS